MARIRYPFLTLAALSAVVALVLLLTGGRRERGGSRTAFARERVAVVELSGFMNSSYDAGARAVSARRVVEQLLKYRDDRSVKAIVLRVDTPGGTVVAAQEIHGTLIKLREGAGKKVVVSMGDVAASGGYYVACAADRIFASPGTLTGSIGVIMQFPSYRELLGKIGVGANTIKSGEFKDLGSGVREMTERDRRLLQGLVDDVFDQFVAAVAAGRRLPVERARALADGRVISGRQALGLGLVDELGDLETAIASAAKLAGIAGEPQVIREKPQRRFWELLDARISGLLPAPLLDGQLGQTRLLYLWQ